MISSLTLGTNETGPYPPDLGINFLDKDYWGEVW